MLTSIQTDKYTNAKPGYMQGSHVHIIIVNYKEWMDTRECLESLLHSVYEDFSVWVIDNNSPNDSIKQLVHWAEKNWVGSMGQKKDFKLFNESETGKINHASLPSLVFIQNQNNAGFAGANNIVLRMLAGSDTYIWLLNPDMIVREDTLDELVKFTKLQAIGSIVGAETWSWPGKEKLLFYGGGRIRFLSGTIQLIKDKKREAELDFISGSCLFTHASTFRQHGLLPEDYFLYWEETDWCYRARQQGAKLLVCPDAICYDKISTVIGKGWLADYYYSRNGLLFLSKFRKKNIAIALGANSLRILKRIVTGRWKRAKGIFNGTIDFLKKKFHAVQ